MKEIIYNNPFQKSLFFNDSLVHYLINYKLDYCFNESMGADLNYHKDDYKFYHVLSNMPSSIIISLYLVISSSFFNLPSGRVSISSQKFRRL